MIYWPKDAAVDPATLGGKAAALLAVKNLGLTIPPWFVVGAPDPDVRETVSPALAEAAVEAARQIAGPNGLVAVRSSARDEDGAEQSFAGQFESFLFIKPEDVPDYIVKVWKSGQSERVLSYRRSNDLDDAVRPPAVLVQAMVDPDTAGVAFSADPVTGQQDVVVVSAVSGVGEKLVSGEVDADTYKVAPDGSVSSDLVDDRPVLDEDEIALVAAASRKLALHFGSPQDVEWAIRDGQFYLLQSRPITSLGAPSDAVPEVRIWDNSNISESYGGVTTPLTFGFARNAYAQVYREFSRILLVPERKIEAHHDNLESMVGLVRGRIYYDLLNWYRGLALLPGYKFNRAFMEQMMGVGETLPDWALPEIASSSRSERYRDAWGLFRSVIALIKHKLGLDREVEKFYANVERTLAKDQPYETMTLQQLADRYRYLEENLLSRWSAPLLNDFFAMIFHGLMCKSGAKWLGDRGAALTNNQLCGVGGMISAEPFRRIETMSNLAREDEALTAALLDASVDEALTEIDARPAFAKLFDAYLKEFGDRSVEELKLETIPLSDDPEHLIRSIGRLASQPQAYGRSHDPDATRLAAEAEIKAALKGHPIRRMLLRWFTTNSMDLLRGRENLRFERTRVFGEARRVFRQIGRLLEDKGMIEHAEDVFYLDLPEVLEVCDDLPSDFAPYRQRIAERKVEFDAYRTGPAPANRIVLRRGREQTDDSASDAATTAADGDLTGIGCCAGVVSGKVRLVTDPSNATILPGEILVAERTDPGWVVLFPACAAILVERGSLLSHAAIVTREMGIPSVVGISGLMTTLKTGDSVTLNGTTGVISRTVAEPVADLEPVS